MSRSADGATPRKLIWVCGFASRVAGSGDTVTTGALEPWPAATVEASTAIAATSAAMAVATATPAALFTETMGICTMRGLP